MKKNVNNEGYYMKRIEDVNKERFGMKLKKI